MKLVTVATWSVTLPLRSAAATPMATASTIDSRVAISTIRRVMKRCGRIWAPTLSPAMVLPKFPWSAWVSQIQ